MGRERVARRGLRGGLIRRPASRRAPLRNGRAGSLTSVRRVRLRAAGYLAARMSAPTLAAARTDRPIAATRIALMRLTSPIPSCAEPHQDTHQEAHQRSVSAGHSAVRPGASKRRSKTLRAFSPRRAASSFAVPERADRQKRVLEHRAHRSSQRAACSDAPDRHFAAIRRLSPTRSGRALPRTIDQPAGPCHRAPLRVVHFPASGAVAGGSRGMVRYLDLLVHPVAPVARSLAARGPSGSSKVAASHFVSPAYSA